MNRYRKRELKQSLLNFQSHSSNAKQKRIANEEVSQLKGGLAETPSLDDLGQVNCQPVQPVLAKFDPKIYGNQRRDFSSSWYTGRPWLEYSLSKKALFCFACRHFNTSAQADTCFIKDGYSNWHHAKEKNKGLNKHANSAAHIQAMVTWKERQQRLSTTTSVSSILQNDQLSKNRYYISSIVDIVHFLCANELPFRGNENEAFGDLYSEDETQPCGLFMKLFQYTLEKDSKLMEYYSTIPKNATYTSAAMQNEIIELLKRYTVNLVVDEIKCSDVPYFTLKCDGTRDLSSTENIAIVIRYLKNGRVLENLVAMPTTQHYDAETLADLIIKELTNLCIDPKRMLSQCYDGASVMSGKIGGVQRKIQNRLEKYIPYVHCLNHQLHLVVVNTIKRIPELATFFDTVNILHNFIKRPRMASLCKGLKLPRLMEHRWSGHFTAIASVIENHSKIVGLLTQCTDSSDSKTCIEATGILHQVRSPRFVFLALVLSKFLHIIRPVDKQLQCHNCDIHYGLGLLKIAKSEITKLRDSLIFDEILKQMSQFNVNEERMRRKACGQRFSDYVVEALLPSQDDWIIFHRKIYFAIIDESLGELDNRFSEQNDSIYSSLASLLPTSETFLDFDALKPLSNLVNCDKSALLSELIVAKAYISKQNMMTLLDIFGALRIVQDAFPNVYLLYGAALTFGSSTATCESSFSTLTRIMTPFRRNMKHQRKSNLVILASLNKYKSSIDKDDFLNVFALHCRRLQLY